jgi:2-polyprenyl-6-methoxyphenol hydroxylase-like FAD-dependent oxidoreductase
MKRYNEPMKIGIIGGSIAGCSAAILLSREGHEVEVFERSKKPLVGRGGGIGTIPPLMDEIKKNGLIGHNFTSFSINKLPFIGKHKDAEPYGKKAAALDMHFQVFQWNELWGHLRKRVPDSQYAKGKKVIHAEMVASEQVKLQFNDSSDLYFDLVLFADGYNSQGRRILFPEKKLEYRGYVLWRGLLPEGKMTGYCPLKDEILRLSYSNQPGHNVVYFIPGQDGSVEKGKRVFNWAAYIAIPEKDLATYMTDENGKTWEGTLPPGKLSRSNENKLKAFLSENTPEYYAEIVNKTKDSYIQVIYTLDLEAYYKERMCLIGDAGMVIQPFTGSGVFKGYNNVKDLIEALQATEDLGQALLQWSDKQLATGKRLLVLGDQMERAFIWDQPDFATIDERSVVEWWKKSISFPKNFNHQKS